MDKKIRMLDCFAGIGGFHLGVEQACKELGIDFECVGAIEFNKHSQETYKANFPNTPLLGMEVGGDITKMDLTTLPKHDMLCGGFPCQAFSRNNMTRIQKLGVITSCDIDDDRLFLYKKLVEIISIYKPQYVLLENVAQLLKMKIGKKNISDIIIKTLTDLGYTVNIKVLDAADYGVPQQRKRLYFVATLNKIKFIFPDIQDRNVCVKDILLSQTKVNDKYYIDNAWSERKMKDGSLRTEYLYKNYKNTFKKGKISTVSTINGETPSGVSRQHDRVYSIYGISRTLATFSHPAFDTIPKWRLLMPREFARLQGFPDTFKLNNNDNISMVQFGNSVCVNVINAITKELLK